LGVEAANKAGIKCIITLNNTPIDISSDFNNLILKETKIFQDTKSTIGFLKKWCCDEIKKINDNDDPDANPSDMVVGTKFVVKKFFLESLMSPLLINAKGLLSSIH
jgi:hypothetical protein